MEDYFSTRGGLTEARLRMARVPEGAELIPNPLSGAPGIRIENVFILAGIPGVAASMLSGLEGKIEGGQPMVSRTVGAYVAESEVADMLRTTEEAHGNVAIGSYPFFRDGRHGANFVVRSDDPGLADACVGVLERKLAEAGFEPVPGGI